ncbi:hypothetical protein ADN00_09740 [Ornatilinea apprima]|uniref:Uncharacterized protein n=1 Tax=Ornatilinea apprima TaxID=1134406 RepID=A0A0N8GN20_9CHLR|nr:hypothetical protein ADN00_09740 [Ornatilinea apprima]
MGGLEVAARLFQPAHPRRGRAVKVGHVGFDVEQGRAVQNIEVGNLQNVRLDADQLNDGDPNRVGARVANSPRAADSRKGVTVKVTWRDW